MSEPTDSPNNNELPSRFRTHAHFAEKFFDSFTEDDPDCIIECIGSVQLDNEDFNPKLAEVIDALSFVIYTDSAEGEAGESLDPEEVFGYGMHLGVHIMTDMAGDSGREESIIASWLEKDLHKKLANITADNISDELVSDAYNTVIGIVGDSKLHVEYEDMLEIIHARMKFSLQQSAAFRNGLLYAIATLTKNLEAQTDVAERDSDNDDFEREFHELFIEDDLHTSFEKITVRFNELLAEKEVPVSELAEEDARQIIDIIRMDFSYFFETLDHIEIVGNKYFQTLHPEDPKFLDFRALNLNGDIVGKFAGIGITVIPVDMTYLNKPAKNYPTEKLIVTIGMVLKEVFIRMSNPTATIPNGNIMIGMTSPGTVFHKIDS